MALTIASIITNLDTYIRDTSNNSISAAERLQYITEATVWLQEELQNDLQNETYDLNYLDTVYKYKVTTAVADLFEAVDMRRAQDDHVISWSRKSPREVAEEIGQQSGESVYAIERHDNDNYLLVNHDSKYHALIVESCDDLTANATWQVDSTNSDATNLTLDEVEFLYGNGSFNFDADVSQSGNNRATIYADDYEEMDLTDYLDLASWVFEVYILDVTNFTSVTLYWGSSSTSYWSASATTDINGSAWAAGWNTVKINWADATATSSPDHTIIDYIRLDYNYGAGQGDDTDFRLDHLRLVRPEKLKFYYTSWSVGETSTSDSTKLYAFAATTNVPFFSGQYDQYKYAVAHKAASRAFFKMGLRDDAISEEVEAIKALNRAKKGIPSSRTPEVKSFKVGGISFRRRTRRSS